MTMVSSTRAQLNPRQNVPQTAALQTTVRSRCMKGGHPFGLVER